MEVDFVNDSTLLKAFVNDYTLSQFFLKVFAAVFQQAKKTKKGRGVVVVMKRAVSARFQCNIDVICLSFLIAFYCMCLKAACVKGLIGLT